MSKDKQAKGELFEGLRRIAVFKGEEVSKERIQLYVEYLKKYDIKKVMAALKTLLDTHPRFPDIAHIVKIVDPPLDEAERGNELAGAIIDAVKTFGQYRMKEAKIQLGAVGWFVVERMGGWNLLCNVKYAELGTMRAQLRDLSKTAHKIAKRDSSDESLLPHEREGTKRIGELLEQFNENKLLT